MPSPIAEAFVRVRPDFTGFQAEVTARTQQALSQVQAPTINAPAVSQVSTAATAAASSATAALNTQAVATGNVTKAQGQQASASAAVITAQRALTAATVTLDEALAAEVVSEHAVALATDEVSIATSRLAAAQARLNTTTAAVTAEEALLARSRLASAGATSAAIGQSRLLQASLQGAGQGALSSRLAFFGLGGAIAAIGVSAFGAAISGAANFEQSMNTLGVVTGATEAQLRQAAETAKQLGADITLPAVSATDASEAILTLSRTGLSLKDSIGGARGVLQLAAAAQTDNATAAITAARALNAFGLAGTEATHVADLLTGASIAGGASIQDMAVALQQSGAAAHQIGISLEETTTLLAVLAKNGLAGSDAGTSLRTAILRLIPTTTEAKDTMAALGISVTDAAGALLPTAQIFENFRIGLGGLSPSLRQVALETIFGTDAFRAIAILSREGAAGIDEAAAASQRQGIAADVAAARTSGLKGQFSALQSNAQTLGVELGSLALGPLTDFLRGLNFLIGAIPKVIGFVGDLKDKVDDLKKSLSDSSGFDFPLVDVPEEKVTGPLGRVKDAVIDFEKTLAVLGIPAFGPLIELGRLLHQDTESKPSIFDEIVAGTKKTKDLDFSLQGFLSTQKKVAANPFTGFDFKISGFEKIADFNKQFTPTKIAPSLDSSIETIKRKLAKAGFDTGENFTANLLKALDISSTDKAAAGIIKSLAVRISQSGAAPEVGKKLGFDLTTDVQNAQELAISNALKQAQLSGNLQEQVRVLDNQIKAYRAELKKVIGNTAASKADREELKGKILDAEKEQQSLIKEQADKARATRADARSAVEIGLQGALDVALSTPGISDDVVAAKAKIAGFISQLAAVSSDADASKSEIASIRNKLDAARRELAQIFATHTKELQADAEDRRGALGIALDRAIAKALRTDRPNDDIRRYRDKVKFLDNEIKRATADTTSTKTEIENLRTARANAFADLQDAISGPDKGTIFEQLEARLQNNLKASGLTEGLSDDIRDATRLVNLYRDRLIKISKEQGRNSLAAQSVRSQFLDAKAQLASLQKETDDSGATGTTAFSLLKQAAETFAANAGNLIGGNQPFAGPTGFTADLSQFLKRATPPQLPLEDHIRFGARQAQEERRTNRLIDALDGLTAAVNNQNGNVAAGVPTQAGGTPTWRSFYISRQTRDAQQARNV